MGGGSEQIENENPQGRVRVGSYTRKLSGLGSLRGSLPRCMRLAGANASPVRHWIRHQIDACNVVPTSWTSRPPASVHRAGSARRGRKPTLACEEVVNPIWLVPRDRFPPRESAAERAEHLGAVGARWPTQER